MDNETTVQAADTRIDELERRITALEQKISTVLIEAPCAHCGKTYHRLNNLSRTASSLLDAQLLANTRARALPEQMAEEQRNAESLLFNSKPSGWKMEGMRNVYSVPDGILSEKETPNQPTLMEKIRAYFL